jgi:hypothetical protein
MKTKSVPYICPVCQGTGVGPQEKAFQEYRYLSEGEVYRHGDKKCVQGRWAEISCVIGEPKVSATEAKDRSFRRVLSTKSNPCKACKGSCVLWGTETDDSVDFGKTTLPVTIPGDTIPWTPYIPGSPYWYPPYIGDGTWKPYITWSTNSTDGLCKDPFRVIKREDYPLMDLGCPNFGF